MKKAPLHFIAAVVLSSVALSLGALAQGIAKPKLKPDDVPRETQMGEGIGRYVAPVPAKPKLPTLWLIGDSLESSRELLG